MTRLLITEPAASDLAGIADYIASDSPRAAERVYWRIVEATEKLVEFPEMGRAGRYPETRELSIPGLPYLVVYEVRAGFVTVLAVFHTSRDLARALHDRMQG